MKNFDAIPSWARLSAVLATLLVPCYSNAETLSALGRILPVSGVVNITGVAGDTIQAITVKEGDWVEAGQSLGALSSLPAAKKKVTQAEADLASERANSEREVALAVERVSIDENEVSIDQERLERSASSRNSEFVSPDQFQDRTLARQNAGLNLDQAKQDLEKARRTGDKAIRAAEDGLKSARDQLAVAELSTPIKSRVLKILGRVGETVGQAGLIKLGDTSSMIVVVEVYEADALKVKVGQRATISSPAFPDKMTGTVGAVSNMVYRNSLESIDPNETTQSRVVEVTLNMDKAKPLDQLVMLQVDVVINL
jgi:HlyD family secretion protein